MPDFVILALSRRWHPVTLSASEGSKADDARLVGAQLLHPVTLSASEGSRSRCFAALSMT